MIACSDKRLVGMGKYFERLQDKIGKTKSVDRIVQ
jgi:hypothetical protein